MEVITDIRTHSEDFKIESIHTALSTNLDKNLVFFDKKHAYVLNLATGKKSMKDDYEVSEVN